MAVNIGPKIGIDGEAEYRKQISNIIQQAKTLDSEMRVVAASFDDATSAEDRATATNKVLTQQIEVQRQKVAALSDMLDKSAQKYGENDIKTLKWRQRVNEATAELYNLEKSASKAGAGVDDLGEGIKNSEKNSLDLGSALGQIADMLGIKLPSGADKAIDALGGIADSSGVKLPSGLQASINGFAGMDKAMLGTVAAAAGVVTAVVAIEKALIDLTLEQAVWAKEVSNVAAQINISTADYQQWDAVLKSVGFSMEQARGDLSQLAEKALDAANGVGEGAEMFGLLGVEVKNVDGSLKSQLQLFDEVYMALLEMEDVTQRNAIASALLSTTGEEALIPMLERYGNTLATVRDKSSIVSEDDIEKLTALSMAVTALDNEINVAKSTIAGQFAPSLQSAAEAGVGLVDSIATAFVESGIGELFGALLDIVTALSPLFDALLGVIGDGTGNVLTPLISILSTVADALAVIANIVAMLIELFRQFFALLQGDGFSTKKLDQYANNLNELFSLNNAAVNTVGALGGTGYWRGSVTSSAALQATDIPKGIHTEAGLQAYNRRLAEDQRIEDGQRMYGDQFNITIDAKNVKEINDVVRMAQNARINRRAGFVRG